MGNTDGWHCWAVLMGGTDGGHWCVALLSTGGRHCWALIISALMTGADLFSDNCRSSAGH
ncbi:unnamed protein product [Staurois parvus]|uniref:Uncharacterized protein n=1 Tax=Staurois parvus TaxID=386267 RepID=A0ABN9DNS5_9NEOB|nr:unnamed protein product [Staurois parvus]